MFLCRRNAIIRSHSRPRWRAFQYVCRACCSWSASTSGRCHVAANVVTRDERESEAASRSTPSTCRRLKWRNNKVNIITITSFIQKLISLTINNFFVIFTHHVLQTWMGAVQWNWWGCVQRLASNWHRHVYLGGNHTCQYWPCSNRSHTSRAGRPSLPSCDTLWGGNFYDHLREKGKLNEM